VNGIPQLNLFAADGSLRGGELKLTTEPTLISANHYQPQAAGLANGGFVMVFTSDASPGADTADDAAAGRGVFMQRFDANGGAIDSNAIQVNNYTYSTQENPVVATLSDGRFVIAWRSYAQDGSSYGVFAKIYNADGSLYLDEFRVNDQTSGDQYTPAITALSNGKFVIAWHDHDGTGGDDWDVWAQIYDSDGSRIDTSFILNENVARDQYLGEITALDGDEFVAAFTDRDAYQQYNSYDVHVRHWGTSVAQGAAPVIEALDTARVFAENTVNAAPQLLDTDDAVAVSDLDSGDFDGGVLTVQATDAYQYYIHQINAPDDRTQDQFSILAGGTGTREVSQLGNDIYVGGVLVGTITSPGTGGLPFAVTFNGTADKQAVERVIERLAYRNVSDDPIADRTARITLSDGDGQISAPYEVAITVTEERDRASEILGERQANTYSTNRQDLAASATLEDGSVILIWSSLNQDGSGWGIYGQRFDALGQKIGGEFHVSDDYTSSNQVWPRIVATGGLDFIVVWHDEDNSRFGSSYDVVMQRMTVQITDPGLPTEVQTVVDVAGSTNTQVNSYNNSTEQRADVAALSNGHVVVVWDGNLAPTDGSSYSVQAAIFDSAGVMQGSQFQVNSFTTNGQYSRAVAGLENGGFVVIYQSNHSGNQYDLYVQRYDNAGVALNLDGSSSGGALAPTLINSYTAGNQHWQRVAALQDGGFVVVWNSEGQDSNGSGIFAQRFDQNGQPVGQEFRVNDRTSGNQTEPDVTGLENGGFVITWTDQSFYVENGSYNYNGVVAQEYDAAGHRVDDNFIVNSEIRHYQERPTVTAMKGGGYMIAFTSQAGANNPGDGDNDGIFYQVYGSTAPQASANFDGTEDLALVLSIADFDAGFFDPEGDTLQEIRIGSLPGQGSLALNGVPVLVDQTISRVDIAAGLLVYTPQADVNGTAVDGFSFFASDGTEYSSESLATINLSEVNDAPQMQAISDFNVGEASATNFQVTLADPDADSYSFTVDWGDGTVETFTSVSKTPSSPYHTYAAEGDYTVNVIVDDGKGQPNSVESQSFTISMVNSAPVPRRDNIWVSEDGTSTGDLFANNGHGIDYDPGSDAFTITAVNGDPANLGQPISIGNGVLITVGANGSISVDANGAYESLDYNDSTSASFTYQITDSQGASNSVTSYIYVDGQNDAPVANDDSADVQVGSQATGNVITGSPDASGADTDADHSAVLRVTQVDGSDVTPGIGGQTFALASGATVHMDEFGNFTYDPLNVFTQNDTDSFDYTLADDRGVTSTATVTINVGGLNQPPQGADDYLSTPQATVLNGDVFADNGSGQDSDPDGDPLTVLSVNGLQANVGQQIVLGSGATLTLNSDGTFAYNPGTAFDHLNLGEDGNDSFVYRLSDGNGGTSGDTTVYITVTGTNDAPVARRNDYSLTEDTTALGNLITDDTGHGVDSDLDQGDVLSIAEVNGSTAAVNSQITLASGALLTVNADGTFSYDPSTAFNDLRRNTSDTDSFTYQLTDLNGGLSNTTTVYLTIQGVNDAPLPQDDDFTVPEDGSFAGESVFADNGHGPDSDPDTRPTADTLQVVAVDGNSAAVGVPYDLPGGGKVTLTAAGTLSFDTDGDFNIPGGQTQDVTFSYTVRDDGGVDRSATVTIQVQGNGAAPVAADDTHNTDEDSSFLANVITGDAAGLGQDTDSDGDALNVIEVNGAAGAVGTEIQLASGALLTLLSNGSMFYDPNSAFDHLTDGANGQDNFSYKVSDNKGGEDTATVTINLAGLNDDPSAADDVFLTSEENTVPGHVLQDNGNGPDTDPDTGDSLTVTAINGQAADIGQQVTLVSGATVTLNADGTFDYDPRTAHNDLNANSPSRLDGFSYEVTDQAGRSSQASVEIYVQGVNDMPVAVDDQGQGYEDETVLGNVLTNDSDPDIGTTLRASELNGDNSVLGAPQLIGSGALVTLNPNGSYSYDPNGAFDYLAAGVTATDSFDYTLSDGQGGFDTANVTITITGKGSDPVASEDQYTTDEDSSVGGNVITDDTGQGMDYDPDPGETVSVTHVEGQPIANGPITLISGAVV
ncbi:MAG: beta strand repeat-containing protein, partial [Mangrovicoccus sp.]